MEQITDQEMMCELKSDLVFESVNQLLYSFEAQRKEFHAEKNAFFSDYMKLYETAPKENALYVFNGIHAEKIFSFESIQDFFSSESFNPHNGGYFLVFENKGIAINPGKSFIKRLTEQGFHIWNIDLVIVTSSLSACSEDLQDIYKMNRALNENLVSCDAPAHVIQYVLHPVVFSKNSIELAPIFRHESHTVHSMHVFKESNYEDTKQLIQDISINYKASFSTQSIDQDTGFLLKLDLKGKKENLTIGFVLGSAHYSQDFEKNASSFFSSCKTLVLGIGDLHFEDIEKVKMQERDLGYYRIETLLHSLLQMDTCHLSYVFLSEFGIECGDNRLEIIRKLCIELQSAPRDLCILPVETGFTTNLQAGKFFIDLEEKKQLVPCAKIRVLRNASPFGKLTFISENDVL